MQLKAPTKLLPEDVRNYQNIVKMEFGEELTYDEAYQEAMELVEFYVALLQARIENLEMEQKKTIEQS